MKPIFTPNEDYRKSSFLNWRMDIDNTINLFNLGNGYLESAKILIEICLKDNRDKKADIIIFPIFTCINHGIEVYIKGLTRLLNILLENNLKVSGIHNLKKLLELLEFRIGELDGDTALNNFKKDFLEITNYIDELSEKIGASKNKDKMDFSRYPFSQKQQNHFYVHNWTNIEVDLENLLERLCVFSEKFESLTDYYYYQRYQMEY